MAEARDCGATRCVDVTLSVPVDDEDAVSLHCDGHFAAEHAMKDVVHSQHLLGNKLLKLSVCADTINGYSSGPEPLIDDIKPTISSSSDSGHTYQRSPIALKFASSRFCI